MSDITIRLESFAGSAKETNPLFKDYNGLLHIIKLPALNTLASHCPESRDLAFKLRRKRFVIEVSRFYDFIAGLVLASASVYILNYLFFLDFTFTARVRGYGTTGAR